MARADRRFLERRAYQLNANLPKSERWFWTLWKKTRMLTRTDRRNKPRHGFIPDIYNRRHYYIIEIDGSSHDTQEAYLRDKRKDEKFKREGYLVVRVKAFDDASFNACVETIRVRRREVDRTMERRKEKLAKSQNLPTDKRK